MSAPIRVLFTIPNFDTAGSGGAMARVIAHLDRSVVEPTVCIRREGGTTPAELVADDVEVIVLPHRVDVSPRPSLPARLRHTAKPFRGRFDVWHSYHYGDDYTEPIVARLAGAKWVYTKKNMSWNHRSWWLRTALAHGVAAQNRDMLEHFFTGPVLGRRAHYVPRGIDAGDRVDRTQGLELRSSLGLGPDTPVVACIAQVIPRKGQRELVRAVGELPGVHVLLAGRTDYEPYVAEVRAAVDAAGVADRVHWLGHLSDITPALAAADVFCLPTGDEAEGCPVALLEAMAAGVPSVATDVPGSRDVVVDGESGVIVEPGSAASLADALGRLLADADLRTRTGAAGRERVATTFSLVHEAQAHEDLYRTVLGRRPG